MEAMQQYRYDTFISYSHKDGEWVSEVLLPTLEKNGITVLVDYRDFEPGAPSITEMERAVEESRKIILVLTPDYIRSAWSEFESIMMATLDPGARQRRIIPILLRSCEMPLRIKYLTYLDFTAPHKIKLQWEKLIAVFDKKVLQDPPLDERNTRSKGTTTAPKISSDTLNRLRKLLMDCDELSSITRLRALFNDQRLSTFKSNVPEGANVAERTDLLIDFLINRRLLTGESLLEIFLDVLYSKISPNDAKMSEFEEIMSVLRA